MKLVSWNVNGLKSYIENGFFVYPRMLFNLKNWTLKK